VRHDHCHEQTRDEDSVSQTDDPEPVGSVAEEAAKLLGALSGWAREHGEGASAMADSLVGELHDHIATGAPECSWCPMCRTVAAIRQTSPEVRAHLTSAASSLMLAVSGMMATSPGDRDRTVERIDLDDDSDGWPEDET
jgi:hypothetical protein